MGKEKVYLGDWLYNAGIVGFLRMFFKEDGYIIEDDRYPLYSKGRKLFSKDEDLLKIEDNYIEFDRKIFDGFADRFFDYTANLYGRYDKRINELKELLSGLESDTTNYQKEYKKFENIINNYTLLKNKLKDVKVKSPEEFKGLVKEAISIMEQDKEEFKENDVRVFLRDFYGQKSFLNQSISKDWKKKFYQDFEEPLKTDSNKKDRKLCVICQQRQAKKETYFDTGFSSAFGLNKDAVNFAWNFKVNLHACDICEIIYFCHFAGLTKVDDKYYFVNSDSSAEDLLINNNNFQHTLRESPDNILIKFFTEYLLNLKTKQAHYTLSSINFIEIKLSETLQHVFSFNIGYDTATFLQENNKALSDISKAYFKLRDGTKVYILTEFLNSVLKKDLNYGFLYEVFRSKLDENAYISNKNLKTLVDLFLSYKQKIGGKTMNLPDGSLWVMYKQGNYLSKVLKERNAENKVPSIAYRLLNALKIGDRNQFMDTVMRIYMTYNLEAPKLLTKGLQDKDNFYLLGYSFVNGFLGQEFENGKSKEEQQ